MKVLFWFRNDLRLHDHEWISEFAINADEFLPVYCFNPHDFTKDSLGFDRVGIHRQKFLLESVWALKRKLQEKGSDLYIVWGKPEDIIPTLAAQFNPDCIGFEKEIGWEEQQTEIRLINNIKNRWFVKTYYGKSLIHPLDLPFSISELPFQFTEFRKKIEANWIVREMYPEPPQLPPLPTVVSKNSGLNQLPAWLLKSLDNLPTKYSFHGGEEAANQRLQNYIWESQYIATYKQTRNNLLGTDYSSRFSPWLSIGSLSPRRVYFEVKHFEQVVIANESTYWLIFELLWRDFFRWVAWKYGAKIFYKNGIKKGKTKQYTGSLEDFERWKNGQTDVPLVDACMIELKQTGFLSNRGRQLVASYLINDLQCDWRWGARWFESQLVDYDVCSNWGNWMYLAGVGNDTRSNRYFNIQKQMEQYDPDGKYIQTWINNREPNVVGGY